VEDQIQTPLFRKMEKLFKHEVRRGRNLNAVNIFRYLMYRYNYLVFYRWRNRDLEELSLLRPNDAFLGFINVIGFLVVWFISIFLCSASNTDVSIGSGFGLGIVAALLGSIISVTIIWQF
jgi:hypothetical protein